MYMEMSDKVNIYVKKCGKGIPCLFVHGGPGEGSLDFEVFGGSSLESFMQMIYFDQRGCARSGGTSSDDYSMDRIIEDIEEIRKRLEIPKWVIIAHSFGGIIATNYVYKYEKFVDKLILLNSTLYMEDSFNNQIKYGSMLLTGEKLEPKSGNSVLEKWQYIFNKLIEKDIFYKLQYDHYKNFLRLNDVSNQIENFNTAMANQAFHNKEYFANYFDITEKIVIPVLIITGNQDYAIGPNHHRNFMFPNKNVKVIQGKHMLYLENNEEFKLVIREFIEQI